MDKKKLLLNEAKRIEEDSLYSSKGHFNAESFWSNFNLIIGAASALISAVAGASALSQFDSHNTVAGILSIIVVGLTSVLTFVNPNEKSALHHKAGNKYNELKNDSRIFYEIELEQLEESLAVANLEKLNKRRNDLNIESHQIPWWAFSKARKGIEEGEAKYKVDN